jgi:hypothetical protein
MSDQQEYIEKEPICDGIVFFSHILAVASRDMNMWSGYVLS